MTNKAKPHLYLRPGLLCDATVWEHQWASLARHAEIHIPVFRGISSFRDMALSVLKDAPEKFSVVGHSMGGRVAFEMMHLCPERIEKFAVMSVGVHPVQPGEAAKRMVQVELAEQQGMAALADVWIPPMVHPSRGHVRIAYRGGCRPYGDDGAARCRQPGARRLVHGLVGAVYFARLITLARVFPPRKSILHRECW